MASGIILTTSTLKGPSPLKVWSSVVVKLFTQIKPLTEAERAS